MEKEKGIRTEVESKIFICDTCKQPIQEIEDGWVEWLVEARDEHGVRHGKGLRLVHHRPASPRRSTYGCQYLDSDQRGGLILEDLALANFLGTDGLMLLLSMLADGDVTQEEFLEMAKRFHIPGYEQARPHFQEAINEGVIEPNLPEGYYWQREIKEVLEFIQAESVSI